MTNEPTDNTTLPLSKAYSQLSAVEMPRPVGYWVMYPGAICTTMFAVYKRPTDEQIKNTEALLGWGWKE